MLRAAAAFAVAAALPAQAEACRLALVLALDVSSSVDEVEYALQRDGLASALLDDTVQQAFLASPDPVALYVFEWSGRYDHVALLPDWQLIQSASDLDRVAAQIAASTRSRSDMPTSMGHALGHASIVLSKNPGCLFTTIDISGDGANNDGFGPDQAYRAFPFAEITVNALVVQSDDARNETDLARYFQQEVIRGPGAFVQTAAGYGDFARAMRRKLLTELAVIVIGEAPAQQASPG